MLLFNVSSRRRKWHDLTVQTLAVVHWLIIIAFFIIEILRIEIDILKDWDRSTYGRLRELALYFTIQINVIMGFVLLGAWPRLRNRLWWINWRIMEFWCMALGSIMVILYWVYLIFIYKVGALSEFHPVEIFFNIWLHFIYPIIAIGYFWMRSWILRDWGILRFWKTFWKSLVYPIIYIAFVIVLYQAVSKDHWSAYQEATIWYQLVDESALDQLNGREVTSQYAPILVPIYALMILALITLFNFISRRVAKKRGIAPQHLSVLSNRPIKINYSL